MKSWLRLTLVTMTVGGGFAGFAGTFLTLSNSQGEGLLALVLRVVFLVLYMYITISGLMFVHNQRIVRPLAAALAMQIPWISSPLLVYDVAAGPSAVIGVGSPTQAGKLFTIDWQLLMGSSWRFEILQGARWRMSVNLLALALLILLRKSTQTGSSTASHATSADPNS